MITVLLVMEFLICPSLALSDCLAPSSRLTGSPKGSRLSEAQLRNDCSTYMMRGLAKAPSWLPDIRRWDEALSNIETNEGELKKDFREFDIQVTRVDVASSFLREEYWKRYMDMSTQKLRKKYSGRDADLENKETVDHNMYQLRIGAVTFLLEYFGGNLKHIYIPIKTTLRQYSLGTTDYGVTLDITHPFAEDLFRENYPVVENIIKRLRATLGELAGFEKTFQSEMMMGFLMSRNETASYQMLYEIGYNEALSPDVIASQLTQRPLAAHLFDQLKDTDFNIVPNRVLFRLTRFSELKPMDLLSGGLGRSSGNAPAGSTALMNVPQGRIAWRPIEINDVGALTSLDWNAILIGSKFLNRGADFIGHEATHLLHHAQNVREAKITNRFDYALVQDFKALGAEIRESGNYDHLGEDMHGLASEVLCRVVDAIGRQRLSAGKCRITFHAIRTLVAAGFLPKEIYGKALEKFPGKNGAIGADFYVLIAAHFLEKMGQQNQMAKDFFDSALMVYCINKKDTQSETTTALEIVQILLDHGLMSSALRVANADMLPIFLASSMYDGASSVPQGSLEERKRAFEGLYPGHEYPFPIFLEPLLKRSKIRSFKELKYRLQRRYPVRWEGPCAASL